MNRDVGQIANSITSHFLSRIIQAGIIIILFTTPFPFGSVQDAWIFSWEIGISALMLLWALVQLTSRETEWARTRMTWPLLTLLVYIMATLMPLPQKMLAIISGETSRIYHSVGEVFAVAGQSPPSMFRISLALTCVLAGIFAIAGGGKSREIRASQSEKHFRKTLIGMLFLASVLIGILLLTSGTLSRWHSILDASARYRISIWNKGIEAIFNFPATGTGLGTFSSIFPQYQNAAYTSEIGHAENEYLQWTMETGFIGLAIAVLVLYAFGRLTYLRLNARKDGYYRCVGYGTLFSITSLGIHNLVDFNAHVTSNALTFAAISALAIIVISYHPAQGGERLSLEFAEFPSSNPRAVALICVLILTSGLISYFGWVRLQSVRFQEQWSRERPFLTEGDPDETKLLLLSESLRTNKWNYNARYLKARFFESGTAGAGILQVFQKRKLLDSARNEILQALSLRPFEATYWSALGRIEAASMNLEAADLAFRQAIRFSSSNGYVQRDYGFFLLSKGNVMESASRFSLARTFATGLDLEQMLAWLSAKTSDRQLWESMIRHQASDLKVYGHFLQSRGLDEDG
jgi:hypothetical protein